MPSQRLLKLLDPWGHVPVLTSTTPKALVWCRPELRPWVVRELATVRIRALLASSVRHLVSSLRVNLQPAAAIAIIELDALGASETEALVAARWAGFTGSLIAIAKPGDPRRAEHALLDVQQVVPPDVDGALESALARWLDS